MAACVSWHSLQDTAVEGGAFELRLRQLSGTQLLSVQVTPGTTIAEVRSRAAEQLPIPAFHELRLFAGSRKLDHSSWSVVDEGLTNNSEVQVLVAPDVSKAMQDGCTKQALEFIAQVGGVDPGQFRHLYNSVQTLMYDDDVYPSLAAALGRACIDEPSVRIPWLLRRYSRYMTGEVTVKLLALQSAEMAQEGIMRGQPMESIIKFTQVCSGRAGDSLLVEGQKAGCYLLGKYGDNSAVECLCAMRVAYADAALAQVRRRGDAASVVAAAAAAGAALADNGLGACQPQQQQ